MFAIEILEVIPKRVTLEDRPHPRTPRPVLQGDTPRGRDNLQVADADKLLIMSQAG